MSRLTESDHKILRMLNGGKYYEGEALTVTSILGKECLRRREIACLQNF